MRLLCTLLLTGFLAVPLPARAQQMCADGGAVGAPAAEVPGKPGEFRRAEGGVACLGGKPGLRSCQAIGPVGIGMDREAVIGRAGEPWEVRPLGKGDIAFHLIGTEEKPLGYYVVTYLQDVVVGVQATLASPAVDELPVGLSSVRPGQVAQRALDVFGAPKKVCIGGGSDGEVWEYAPFPLSIDMQYGRVFSIKIFDPEADLFGKTAAAG